MNKLGKVILSVILGEIILAIFLFLSLSSQPVLIPIGNSMFPTIQPGDIVIYKRISSLEEVEVGDIIVFKAVSRYSNLSSWWIHRLISKDPLLTKGDNNPEPDYINPDELQVVGKVTHIIPHGFLYIISFYFITNFLAIPLISFLSIKDQIKIKWRKS